MHGLWRIRCVACRRFLRLSDARHQAPFLANQQNCEGKRECGKQQQHGGEGAMARDGRRALEPKGASDSAKEDAVVAAVRAPGRARVAQPSEREKGDLSAIGSGQRRRAKQTARGTRGGRERRGGG